MAAAMEEGTTETAGPRGALRALAALLAAVPALLASGCGGHGATSHSDGGDASSMFVPIDARADGRDGGPSEVICASDAKGAKQLGDACGCAADCASNFCVDGVCCNTACTDTCKSCT